MENPFEFFIEFLDPMDDVAAKTLILNQVLFIYYVIVFDILFCCEFDKTRSLIRNYFVFILNFKIHALGSFSTKWCQSIGYFVDFIALDWNFFIDFCQFSDRF